jgi:glutamate N-acetyltransferase/amino-acid N-acetyltransferase
MAIAKSMAALAGRIVGAPPNQVLVCSTGVIGVPLPFEKIERRSGELQGNMSVQGIDSVSKAILTTDTLKGCTAPSAACPFNLGMTKAGMIHPRMATLAFVLTSAHHQSLLEEALMEA